MTVSDFSAFLWQPQQLESQSRTPHWLRGDTTSVWVTHKIEVVSRKREPQQSTFSLFTLLSGIQCKSSEFLVDCSLIYWRWLLSTLNEITWSRQTMTSWKRASTIMYFFISKKRSGKDLTQTRIILKVDMLKIWLKVLCHLYPPPVCRDTERGCWILPELQSEVVTTDQVTQSNWWTKPFCISSK